MSGDSLYAKSNSFRTSFISGTSFSNFTLSKIRFTSKKIYDTVPDMMITICKTCENYLEQRGELVFSVFEEICHHYIMTDSPMMINPNESREHKIIYSVVKYLESKEYVTTMDSPEFSRMHIKIKPNGLTEVSKNLTVICPQKCKHEQEIT